MDWDIVLQAFGVLVGALLGASQLLARLPKSRATLKHDLEVLKLLDLSHPQRELIERQVQVRIGQIYGAGHGQRTVRKSFVVHQWDDFVLGVTFMFGGTLWSLYLLRGGFGWWVLLSGFMAFAGFGGILNGLEDKTRANKPLQPTSGGQTEAE